jgi:AcrR family transcriptional regulator
MARKPSRPKARRAAAPHSISASGEPARQRIIDAFLALLAEKSFEQVGLAEIASTAGVTLAELRDEFGSSLAILAAYIKEIDRKVLSGSAADMAEESPRERLFDVLMRRLDVLEPHKPAVRSLLRSAGRNPGLALALNGLGVRSQQWMLTAAGITASGPKGVLRAQGLVFLFANVLRTWVDDEDEGHAKTLAALDRELARGQRMVGLLDGLCAIPARACRVMDEFRRPRRGRSRDEMEAA